MIRRTLLLVAVPALLAATTPAFAAATAAPAKPVLDNVTRSAGKVTFHLNDLSDATAAATSFRVLSGPDAAHLTEQASVPSSGSSTSYTDPDTADGARTYAAEAINDAGTSAMSDPLVLDLALRAPTALQGTALTSRTDLSWTAPTGLPADPITGYAVYRGTTAAVLTQVATVPATSWTGPATAAGAHAFFAVAALTSASTGPRSDVLDVTGTATQLLVAQGTTIDAVPLAGGPGKSLVSDGLIHPDLAVNPNGTSVAYTSTDGALNRELWVRKTDGTGTPTPIVTDHVRDTYSPSWSPDGRSLAYAKDDTAGVSICRVSVPVNAAGACIPVTTNNAYDEPSWLDPTTLVVSDYISNGLAKLTIKGAATTIAGTSGGYTPVVSPDGVQVAFLAPGATDVSEVIRVVNLSTHVVRTLPAPSGMLFGTPSWTRDMSALYVVGGTSTESHVYRIGLGTGGAATTVTGLTGDVWAVAVDTPDVVAPVNVKLGGIPAVTLGTTVTPTFSASDALNKIASYEVSFRYATYSGSYSGRNVRSFSRPTAIGVSRGNSYCFTVAAIDRANNKSAPTAEQCVVVPLDDRSLARSSGFAAVTSSAYYAGTAAKATARGQTLTRTGVTSIRQLTVIASACSTCGIVDVLIGGVRVGSINTVSARTVNRKVFTLPAFTTVRTGTVTLRVASSGKPVIIDGLGFRK